MKLQFSIFFCDLQTLLALSAGTGCTINANNRSYNKALASVPEVKSSNCSSYYVLMQKYYDRDFEVFRLKQYTEKDWKKYKIQSDVPELMNFDSQCVIELGCDDTKDVGSCQAKIKPTFMTGTDDRTADTKPIYESTTISDKDLSFLDKNHFKDATPKTTIEKLPLNESTTEDYTTTIAETSSSSHDIDTDLLNFTEKNTSVVDSAELTTPWTEESLLTETTTDDTGDDGDDHDHTTLLASYEETTTDPNDFSKEETTNVNIETFNDNPAGKSGKYAVKPSEGLQAGKIAAGIMGVGALIATVLVVKKIVIGCLQSGVYHIPAEPACA